MKYLCLYLDSGGMAQIYNAVVVEAEDPAAAKSLAIDRLNVTRHYPPPISVTPFEELTDGWAWFT